MNSSGKLSNLAIIGSGPSTIYLLRNILNHIGQLKSHIQTICVFEKEVISGMGMPYHPHFTDIYNLANISSEEIPVLQQTLGDWLRQQDSDTLKQLNVSPLPIDDSKVYTRLALGHYFNDQYKKIKEEISDSGINVSEYCESEIRDIFRNKDNTYTLVGKNLTEHLFSSVVIATGHLFNEEDIPDAGYFASPWPIHKLISGNKLLNFPVGTLGASLSAFDVVTSLSHRQGTFHYDDNHTLSFVKHKEAPNFKLVLYSSQGWLPHLQYEQAEPMREIYRHFSRADVLSLLDENGKIRIENFFDKLCRPALISAFKKDQFADVVSQLQGGCSLKELITTMSDKHEYVNSFEGMKSEFVTARHSVENKIPIYWMETLDDLMYSLNYHAELLPAEDHIFLHKEVMSFLMNVIAALPLQSAEIMLALYESDAIELQSGRVTFRDDSFGKKKTTIYVESESGDTKEVDYQLFINCAGQKKLEIEDFPFPSLVESGTVRSVTVPFADADSPESLPDELRSNVVTNDDREVSFKLSGIDIDASYKTIGKDGIVNANLYDISFTHTNGLRPYSYGLQACNATSLMLVESWLSEVVNHQPISDIEDMTRLYEDVEEL